MNYTFLGIDPGKLGAIAKILEELGSQDPDYVGIVKCPVTQTGKTPSGSKKTETDIRAIRKMLDLESRAHSDDTVIVTIEKVHAMRSTDGGNRRMGAQSSFNFGMNYGAWMGAIPTHWRLIEAYPGKWKDKILKPLGLNSKSEDAVYQAVDRLYPNHSHLYLGPQGGRDDNKAEAILLAHYGKVVAREQGIWNVGEVA